MDPGKLCLAPLGPPPESQASLSLACSDNQSIVHLLPTLLHPAWLSPHVCFSAKVVFLRRSAPRRQDCGWLWIAEPRPNWDVMWSSRLLWGDRKSQNWCRQALNTWMLVTREEQLRNQEFLDFNGGVWLSLFHSLYRPRPIIGGADCEDWSSLVHTQHNGSSFNKLTFAECILKGVSFS